MICNQCNKRIPDNSEFCQYCGNKIGKSVMTYMPDETALEEREKVDAAAAVPATPVVSVAPAASVQDDEPDFDNMTQDEALDTILKIQAKETVRAMEANSRTQADNEDDADFGLAPEKPIFTLALQSVDGEEEYLNNLYSVNGAKIKYNRRGSTSVDGINGLIDIYDTFLPNGKQYKTIYINMYGAKRSTKAPAGFVLNTPAIQPRLVQKKEKPVKTKYCSRCGSVVDNKTKVCTGCGKKYFKGLRFTKFSITVMVLTFVIVLISTLSVFQYINIREVNRELKDEISNLERGMSIRESAINRLANKVSDLENTNWENLKKLCFYDDAVVVIGNDGTDVYHKYGCSKLDISNGYLILNSEAADYIGYERCSWCND